MIRRSKSRSKFQLVHSEGRLEAPKTSEKPFWLLSIAINSLVYSFKVKSGHAFVSLTCAIEGYKSGAKTEQN